MGAGNTQRRNISSVQNALEEFVLQATFSDTNLSFNDGDVLSEGAGDIFPSSNDPTHQTNSIISNDFRVELTSSNPSGTEKPTSSVVVGAAGKKIIYTIDQDVAGVYRAATGLNTDTAGTYVTGSNVAIFNSTTNSNVYVSEVTGDVAQQSFTISTFPSEQNSTRAIVLGGFDSVTGEPSTTGTRGGLGFIHNGSTWELLAATTAIDYAGKNLSFSSYCGGFGTVGNYIEWNSVIAPTATDTSVFTPVGYALDTFTDVNGTTLPNHTAEANITWSLITDTASCSIQSNAFTIPKTTSSTSCLYSADVGMSDYFLSYKGVHGVDATAGNNSSPYIRYRYVDVDNFWSVGVWTYSTNPDTWSLYERTGGSTVQRASFVENAVNGTAYTVSVRVNGTSHEAWINGGAVGNKLFYTSSNHQSATGTAVALVWNYSSTTAHAAATVEYVKFFPLTSSTYDTALTTTDLVPADCDLYHKFDAISDTTFSSGDVIYGDYLEDGAGRVTLGGSASMHVTNNRL